MTEHRKIEGSRTGLTCDRRDVATKPQTVCPITKIDKMMMY